MDLTIGDVLKVYFQKGNMNNAIYEVRGIIDEDYIVVVSHPKGNYKLEHKSYFDRLYKDGWVTLIS